MSNPEIERDAVAARAYALYVRRGMKPGRELDDWLEAERQLRDEAVFDAVARAPAATDSPASPPAPPAPASPAEPPAAGTSARKKRSRKRR